MNQMSISRDLTNRLRISGPLASDEEAEETRKAFQEGCDMLAREGHKEINLRDVIWRLMQDAAVTLSRLPDRERTWLYHSCDGQSWPEIARPSEEVRAVEDQIKNETEIEDLRRVSKLVMLRTEHDPVRLTITDPTAPRRMLTVLGWLRFVKAKTYAMAQRNKLALYYLAAGKSYGFVRSGVMGYNCSDSAIRDARESALRHIGVRLHATIPNLLTVVADCGSNRSRLG